jgi:transposase
MRKIRDVLRLSAAGLSKRQIAASLGIGPTAAGACLRRAREAGISWPLPDDVGDDALERRLYPAPAAATKDWRSLPDWPAVHRELRRKGVTLQLVWEEYRATHPDGYDRSWFCELYRAWEGRLSPTMRQAHVAGEKLFVDYAGTTIDIFDATTGEVQIIAKLRDRQFFSLPELNAAIRECLVTLNGRVSRHLGASRRALFDATDRSALKPLPTAPYVYAEWKQCRAGLDYHVEVAGHYYSVPHALLRETLWARITARTIELFHQGNRVAVHVRSSSNRRHTTVREHMPSSHRRYADWTPERIQRRANEIGPKTSALIEIILRERTHPEQGFRAAIGILRHASNFGIERLEAACGRALDIGARSYTSVTSILKNNLDRQKAATATDGPAIVHSNIRGPRYFH